MAGRFRLSSSFDSMERSSSSEPLLLVEKEALVALDLRLSMSLFEPFDRGLGDERRNLALAALVAIVLLVRCRPAFVFQRRFLAFR